MADNFIHTTVTIHYMGMPDGYDNRDEFQCFDLLSIPAVGEELSVYSSRDSNGDYREDGKPMKLFSGIVDKITNSIEQRGSDSNSYRITHYIDVYVREKVDKDY